MISKVISNKSHNRRREISICAIIAIAVITICSKSSFLYPLNDWVDANCYFTVGKSVLDGVVMYRDLLEHKGPFLYFLHTLASLISYDSFIGVYMIECIAAFFFLYYSYKTLCLLTERTIALSAVPVLALLVYTSPAFCHGDSAEELCLPFLAFAFYVSIKAICSKSEISSLEYFIIGITSGLVFWTKFTIVSFYIGWFIGPAAYLIRQKKWNALGKAILLIAAGVLVSTVPFFIYFVANHAVGDWLEVYLYNNLFLYTDTSGNESASIWCNLFLAYFAMALKTPSFIVLGFIAIIWFAASSRSEMTFHFFSTFVATFVITYMAGKLYPYYALIMAVFIPYGIAGIFDSFAKTFPPLKTFLNKRLVFGLLAALCMVLTFYQTPNRYLMGEKKENMPQYQFAKIINQEESPTLLNFGFLDGGFYTACEIVPNCKAFCTTNLPHDEMYELQIKYLVEGLCDYVITRDAKLKLETYELIAQSEYVFENMDHIYYLYKFKG